MKLKMAIIALIASVLLIGCNGNTNEESTAKDNDVKDIKELVHDYSVGNIEDESASITSTQLIVTDDKEKETVYELPEDEFFCFHCSFCQ